MTPSTEDTSSPTINYDVIILGAGIIGALSAYECAKAGAKVLLIDKYPLKTGASANSAAMTESQLDAHRGDPFFTLARASLQLFPTLHQEIKKYTGIDFQYEECGILQLAMSQTEAEHLQKEVERQKKMGLRIQWFPRAEVQKQFPSLTIPHQGGAFYQEDGQVNGTRFLDGALTAAQKMGTVVWGNAGDSKFITDHNKISGVEIKKKTYTARTFIAAAGAWTDTLLKPLGLELGITPIRGQLAVYQVPAKTFPFPVYTTKDGYITPKRDGLTLAGTTVEEAGFENRTTEEGRKKITSHAEAMIQSIKHFPLEKMTTGLRPRPPKDLPIIGPTKKFPQLLIATGHYRNGILLAPITAKIMASLVRNKPLPQDISAFCPAL